MYNLNEACEPSDSAHGYCLPVYRLYTTDSGAINYVSSFELFNVFVHYYFLVCLIALNIIITLVLFHFVECIRTLYFSFY